MNRRDVLKIGLLALSLPCLNANSEPIEEPKIKRIYLTIDDGPGYYMDEILERLSENNGKVIFYVIGKNSSNERGNSLLCKAIENGHIIGNHSYTHANFSNISLESAKSEILRTDEIIESSYQKICVERKIKLFRFPYGNTKKSVIPFLNDLGYKPIKSWSENKENDWDIDTLDWRYGKGLRKDSIMNICRKTKDGDVILIHDQPRPMTFTARTIIPYYLNKQEYELILPE